MQTTRPTEKLDTEAPAERTAPVAPSVAPVQLVVPPIEPLSAVAPEAGSLQPFLPVPVVVSHQDEVGGKEWLEFGQAFAWPLLILVLALIFRKQVSEKIENMASLKTPVAESSWNAQAATVAEVAEATVEGSELESEKPQHGAASDAESGLETPSDADHQAEHQRPSRPSPDMSDFEAVGSVLLMWQLLENTVKGLAASRNVSTRNFAATLRWLAKTNVISPTTLELIEQLRRLRNEVVHLRGASVDAESYKRSVLAVIETLDQARNRPQASPPPPPPPPPG